MATSKQSRESDTPKRRTGPRAPSRGRGVARYKALLEATENLLASRDPDEVGLYQIAEEAGVPPPSVYHFFPTKEAAFSAVAENFTERLLDVHRRPIAASRLRTWPDLLQIDIDRARDCYNASIPALKIFYGGHGGVNAKNIDELVARKISTRSYDRLNFLFHMPPLARAPDIFEMRLAILDAIWAVSVRRHGSITEQYHRDAFEACVAFSRLHLPTYLERRAAIIDAENRGLEVRLAHDDDLVILDELTSLSNSR